ncbi:hypothetical protein QR680_016685 [Steinernema hermaphroditum]|uniref:Uncharacterized protein n=1 Tax=Steinernema hermaphroditum TaxID=289476 RepID=A0AA39LMC3_9BILA|nr:hypothetical protein QR680_016685 [Steinernema hermaphroditum]
MSKKRNDQYNSLESAIKTKDMGAVKMALHPLLDEIQGSHNNALDTAVKDLASTVYSEVIFETALFAKELLALVCEKKMTVKSQKELLEIHGRAVSIAMKRAVATVHTAEAQSVQGDEKKNSGVAFERQPSSARSSRKRPFEASPEGQPPVARKRRSCINPPGEPEPKMVTNAESASRRQSRRSIIQQNRAPPCQANESPAPAPARRGRSVIRTRTPPPKEQEIEIAPVNTEASTGTYIPRRRSTLRNRQQQESVSVPPVQTQKMATVPRAQQAPAPKEVSLPIRRSANERPRTRSILRNSVLPRDTNQPARPRSRSQVGSSTTHNPVPMTKDAEDAHRKVRNQINEAREAERQRRLNLEAAAALPNVRRRRSMLRTHRSEREIEEVSIQQRKNTKVA